MQKIIYCQTAPQTGAFSANLARLSRLASAFEAKDAVFAAERAIILDMARTPMNVIGDSLGALVVSRLEGDFVDKPEKEQA